VTSSPHRLRRHLALVLLLKLLALTLLWLVFFRGSSAVLDLDGNVPAASTPGSSDSSWRASR
jgi:hypothetical protein